MKIFNCIQTYDYNRIISVSNTLKLFNCMQTNDYIRIISVSNTWKYLTEYKQMIILVLLLLVILENI